VPRLRPTTFEKRSRNLRWASGRRPRFRLVEVTLRARVDVAADLQGERRFRGYRPDPARGMLRAAKAKGVAAYLASTMVAHEGGEIPWPATTIPVGRGQ
jgi:hypothetical protein